MGRNDNPFRLRANTSHGKSELAGLEVGRPARVRWSVSGSDRQHEGEAIGEVVRLEEDWVSVLSSAGVRTDLHACQIIEARRGT